MRVDKIHDTGLEDYAANRAPTLADLAAAEVETIGVSTSLRGLWGGDQIGQVSGYNSWLYFNNLYVKAYTTDPDALSLTVGRQYYEIGGLGGTPDYVLADVVDWVRADIPIAGFGKIIVIPVNVSALSGDDAGPDFVSYIGQSNDLSSADRWQRQWPI